MILSVETEQEEDGRWIAEISQLPDMLAYGETKSESVSKAEALALRVLAEGVERSEPSPELAQVFNSFVPKLLLGTHLSAKLHFAG